MTYIFMVHLSFYAIPLLIYDVMYDITTTPYYPANNISTVFSMSCNGRRNVYEITISLICSLKLLMALFVLE